MIKSSKKKGQTLVEYGLIIALMAAVLIGGLILLKDNISSTFSTATSAME